MDQCTPRVATRYIGKLAELKLTEPLKWALKYVLERGFVVRDTVLSPVQAKKLVAAGLIVDSKSRPGRPNVVYLTPDGERLARTL